MTSENLKLLQQKMCSTHEVEFVGYSDDSKLGFSSTVDEGTLPIHGLRHRVTDSTSGWYVWAGDYSESVDFFIPLHCNHLREKCPQIIKFLGLPPGWRFLLSGEHEDVWFDESLLTL